MPYTTAATSRTPALIVYLIDISGSMNDPMDGRPKIEHVQDALRTVLQKMVQRSTKGEIVSPRYRIAMLTYNDEVANGLPAGCGEVATITDVVRLGRPTFRPGNGTNTALGFERVRDLLAREMPNQADRPAPLVCHLTDGQFMGADPSPVVRQIQAMANNDGNVLVENIYIGRDLVKKPILNVETWPGLRSKSEVTDSYAETLFEMSSMLPESYCLNIENEGFGLKPGSRMLLPCDNRDLIELAFAASGATPTTPFAAYGAAATR